MIESVEGPSPRPPGGTYVITINTPSGPMNLPGQFTYSQIWSQITPIDAGRMVGMPVCGCLMGQQIVWTFIEAPAVDVCPGTPMPPGGLTVVIDRKGLPVVTGITRTSAIPVTDGGGSRGNGNTNSGAIGGPAQ